METSQRPLILTLGICIFSLQWLLTHQQVNVALRGIATQSSSGSTYLAPSAIDGNRNSAIYSGSCTHTNPETDPWWRVDLLAVYQITKLIITNRGDCCPERINGAEIHIGNSLINNGNNNPRCTVISSIPAGASVSYTCHMPGRYVNIFIPGPNHVLSLCEVEVYVPVTLRAFLKLKFISSEDLSNPTIWEEVNQKIKSVQPSISHARLTMGPVMETEN
ncbi:fucolectin-like [Tachysurus fulvidraco]|uniref:fucolectin-like n=1 Tax=Tachysurus fulvidraco TaxID=1234273 RepID=UPI000F4FCE19|nr:fucolectin-like [Tachysurus fulvidraco]